MRLVDIHAARGLRSRQVNAFPFSQTVFGGGINFVLLPISAYTSHTMVNCVYPFQKSDDVYELLHPI